MCPAPSGELHALSEAVLAGTQHLSVGEVPRRIVRSARPLLDAEYAALGVPDASDSFAQFVVDAQWRAIGPLPRQTLGAMYMANKRGGPAFTRLTRSFSASSSPMRRSR